MSKLLWINIKNNTKPNFIWFINKTYWRMTIHWHPANTDTDSGGTLVVLCSFLKYSGCPHKIWVQCTVRVKLKCEWMTRKQRSHLQFNTVELNRFKLNLLKRQSTWCNHCVHQVTPARIALCIPMYLHHYTEWCVYTSDGTICCTLIKRLINHQWSTNSSVQFVLEMNLTLFENVGLFKKKINVLHIRSHHLFRHFFICTLGH